MHKKIVVFMSLVVCLTGCTGNEQGLTQLRPQSILFIGNSFTSANGGLELMLDQLATSKDPTSQLFTAAITRDGATLKGLWNDSNARSVIQMGAYELVVLQADIPEGDVPTFNNFARKFVAEAAKAGSSPVLLMGWAYERLNWITQEEIAFAHYAVAAETGVDVAPVGLAWSRVMEQRPELNLYATDREHPSVSGSYLMACVVYATVMNESPEGATLLPNTGNIDAEEVRFLQQAAWDTVKAYRRRRPASH